MNIDDETFADAQCSDTDNIMLNNIGCKEVYQIVHVVE